MRTAKERGRKRMPIEWPLEMAARFELAARAIGLSVSELERAIVYQWMLNNTTPVPHPVVANGLSNAAYNLARTRPGPNAEIDLVFRKAS